MEGEALVLAQQDTTFPSLGELLAPRAPSESLTPIADALFPPLPWDFAALPEWKAQRRVLRRFVTRWHAARKRWRRMRPPLLVLRTGELLVPALREFLDGLAEMIARDLLRRREREPVC